MTDLTEAGQLIAELGVRPDLNNQLVVAAALERQLSVGADPQGRVLLTDNKQAFWYAKGRSDINSPLAFQVAKHKEVASALLRSQRVTAARNVVFTADEADQAWAWAEPLLPVVVKPNNAKHGDQVHLDLVDRAAFDCAFAEVCASRHRALVEESVTGIEHRVLVIDQQIVAVTRRVPAHVLGDGLSSVTALVASRNSSRTGDPIHEQVWLDPVALAQLSAQNLTPESVPAPGQRVWLRGTSNLHTGGDAIDASDDLSRDETDFVLRGAEALDGLRLAGFDVMLPRDGVGSTLCILEVNASPMLAMHHFPLHGRPRDAAGRLVAAMFGG